VSIGTGAIGASAIGASTGIPSIPQRLNVSASGSIGTFAIGAMSIGARRATGAASAGAGGDSSLLIRWRRRGRR
jgi:hypothetical protein